MIKISPPFNASRRSWVFLLTWILGLGLLLLVMAYAGKAPPVRAEGASTLPAEANLEVKNDITWAPLAPQAADLEIGKEGPDTTYAGRVLTYTVRITNHTGSTLNNVVVTDTWVIEDLNENPSDPSMPAEFNGNYWINPPTPNWISAFIYTTPTQQYRTGVARWELAPLQPGFKGTIQFTMTVPVKQQPLHGKTYRDTVGPSTLGNSAEIQGSGVTVNDPDNVVTVIVGPLFKLEKFEATEPGVGPRPGRLITYTLRLDNVQRSDSVPATGVVIWEILPSELTYVDAWADVSGSTVAFDPASRHITWTLRPDYTLQVGDVTTVTFVARLSTTQEWKVDIENTEDRCRVISNELAKPVDCWEDLDVETLGMVDKTYVAEPDHKRQGVSGYVPLSPNEIYPNRYVTYTVYVFNPLHQSVASNLTITDVMPPTWDYVRMIDGPAPQSVNANTVVWHWSGVALQANGVMSFTFLALVGPDTPVQGFVSCGVNYYNDMAASADEFPIVYEYGKTFGTGNGLAEVKAISQIKFDKMASHTAQVAGELVTYTVTVENQGDQPVSQILLTDTLPPDFRFAGMVFGPLPDYEVDNVIAWDLDITIDARDSYTLSFKATVDGNWGSSIGLNNNMNAYSPETSVCPKRAAPVKVLSPIVFQKTANPAWDSGERVVQGEWFTYRVTYTNRSKSFSATADEFLDELPIIKGNPPVNYDGFEVGGRDPYTTTTHGLPAVLQPNEATNWVHQFTVDTPGFGAGTAWCDTLSITEDDIGGNKFKNQEIYQEKLSFGVHVDSAVYTGWAINADEVSPIFFKPHVDLFQTVHPKKVGMNGTVGVTLTLYNNMRNHNGQTERAVNGIVLTYELPSEFVFVEMVNGPAPTTQTDEMLTWTNINLPSGEDQRVDLHFHLRAPFEETKFSPVHGYAYAMPSDPSICIPESEADYWVTKGVAVDKKPVPSSTGPFGVVVYTLNLINETTAPVTGLVITDTLPDGFEFIAVEDGYPAPYSVEPLVWRDLSIEASPVYGTKKKLSIKFRVRTSGLFGTEYENLVDGVSAGTYVTYTDDYHEDVLVRVVPGVALYKLVKPEQAEIGQTVIYTLTVHNLSTKDIANVRITDTLPPGFVYQNMVQGSNPISTTPDLVWTVDRLNTGLATAFVFRALIEDQLATDVYCNQAVATAYEADNPTREVNVPDTDLTACVAVKGLPSFQRSKLVSPSTVRAGNLVTYTITLYNDSGEPLIARITDTLPVSLTYAGVLGGTPQPVSTSPLVWGNLNLAISETLTLIFQAEVDLYARSGTYYNRLDAATSEFKLAPKPYLAPLEVEEIPRYDLQIFKSDGRTRVDEGEFLLYTITYTNANQAGLTLNNVIITDTFGPQLYATPSGSAMVWQQIAPDKYTYFVGDLGPGESDSVTFTLQLAESIPDTIMVISNSVEIGHATSELAFETNPSNDHFTDLNILHGIDLLVMGVQVSPAEPKTGEPITFSVTLRNQGDVATANGLGESWFPVDLYLKGSGFVPAGPPGAVYSPAVFDHYGSYCGDYPDCTQLRPEYFDFAAGLDGYDAETVLQFTVVVSQAGEYALYVQVDTSFTGVGVGEPWGHDYGLVFEAIETNNIYSHGQIFVSSAGSTIYLPIILKNS